MRDRLRAQWREREGRDPMPGAAVLDAQSTRSSPQGGTSGYDAAKKIKGRKRHVLVDTLGLMLAVSVTAASVQDRDGAHPVMANSMEKYTGISTAFVDGGYVRRCAQTIHQQHDIEAKVVRHPANGNVGRRARRISSRAALMPMALQCCRNGGSLSELMPGLRRHAGW